MAEITAISSQEKERAASLLDAQSKAAELFEIIERDLIRPGISEADLSKEIFELAAKRFDVERYWHKRVVRSGPNTLQPYNENPPNLLIQPDDIMFVDLGPVFEKWEADFGRTYVLGDDPVKAKLRDTLEPLWKEVKAQFDRDQSITGEQLYRIACDEAKKSGWEFGGVHAGHLVGDFPHERIPNDKISLFIIEGNNARMRSLDKHGNQRHWILEMHLVDRERQIGGFFEQLLTID